MRAPGLAAIWIAFAYLIFTGAHAAAAVSIKVLGTDPHGPSVVLGRNQNFYLRIGYHSDGPIQIWARPYFHGKEVNAGTNPSRTYTGNGEALGWFFFMQGADQVDEIRIDVGDGTHDGTHTAAIYPVAIITSQADNTHVEPAWVTELRQSDKAAQDADYQRRMNTPPTRGETVLFSGFMLVMLGLGVFGFAAPAWGVWRWRGAWRMAAAVPVAMMAFVVVRLLIGVAQDPTSHNLWPFEILQAGALSIGIMMVLVIARRLSAASR